LITIIILGYDRNCGFLKLHSNFKHHNISRPSIGLTIHPLPMSLLCCYTNTTESVQIARIADLPCGYLDRVIFPGVCLLFEAPAEAHLEIHSGTVVSAIVSDRIPCDRIAFS
jgi:hypothetical protein